MKLTRCPNCNCRDIGKIGTSQFYCWGCFVEFSVTGEKVKLYQVEEDGSLVSYTGSDSLVGTADLSV